MPIVEDVLCVMIYEPPLFRQLQFPGITRKKRGVQFFFQGLNGLAQRGLADKQLFRSLRKIILLNDFNKIFQLYLLHKTHHKADKPHRPQADIHSIAPREGVGKAEHRREWRP